MARCINGPSAVGGRRWRKRWPGRDPNDPRYPELRSVVTVVNPGGQGGRAGHNRNGESNADRAGRAGRPEAPARVETASREEMFKEELDAGLPILRGTPKSQI